MQIVAVFGLNLYLVIYRVFQVAAIAHHHQILGWDEEIQERIEMIKWH